MKSIMKIELLVCSMSMLFSPYNELVYHLLDAKNEFIYRIATIFIQIEREEYAKI